MTLSNDRRDTSAGHGPFGQAGRTATVWVVDDDDSIRWVLERALASADRRVQSFSRATDAWRALEAGARPHVILADIRMPGLDGLKFLERVRELPQAPPVIIMTAYSDLDSAVSAYQTGAFDYLPKPFDVEKTRALVERALSTTRVDRRVEADDDGDHATGAGLRGALIGEAPAMQEVFRAIGRLARSNITVLVQGESGSGKELVARALHEHSTRANGPLIAINTAAIPKDLLESELFGHEKGAFTGANQMRRGRFEQAHGGTLFLDEIGDMPFDLQTRLLRVLADGSFYRVGGQTPIQVDVRIIAATHQNLIERVRDGRFREDLYHRLNVIRVDVPPLRARREDIPLLTRHFLARIAAELGVEPKQPTRETMAVLTAHHWPGNVRQLENTCRWMTVMAAGREVLPADLPPELRGEWHGADASGRPPGHPDDRPSKATVLVSDAAAPNPWAPRPDASLGANRTWPSAQAPGTGARDPAAPGQDASGDGEPRPQGDEDPDAAWEQALEARLARFFASGQNDALSVVGPVFERALIRCALARTHGHRSRAAQLIGWGRNTLTRKIQELGIDHSDTDDAAD